MSAGPPPGVTPGVGGPPGGAVGGPPGGIGGGGPPGAGGPPGGPPGAGGRPDFTNPEVIRRLGMYVPKGFGQPGYKPDDKRPGYTAIEVTLGFIALVLVIGRMYSRLRVARAFGWDDGLMAAATVVAMGLFGVEMALQWSGGMGLHIADTFRVIGRDISLFTPMMGWIFSLLHVVAICLIKLSIVVFCIRLLQTRRSAYVAKGLIAIVLAFGISSFFLFLLQCSPPSGYWKNAGGLKVVSDIVKTPTCLPKHTIHLYMTISNGVLDVIVWLLPFPALLKLQIARNEKIGIIVIFIIGGVACIASLIRPSQSVGYSSENDPPWHAADFSLLAMVEVELGIIGASIPAWKILVAKWKPEWFGSLGSRFTNQSQSNGSSVPNKRRGAGRKGSSATTESTEEFGPDVYPLEHKYAGNRNHSVVVSGEGNKDATDMNGVTVTREYDLQSRHREKNSSMV